MSSNICIYFSDTGGGHRSAADAVEAGILALINDSGNKPDVKISKDTVAEKSHPVNRFFAELYNYILRHHQPLMKYYYWLIHAVRPETGFNGSLTAEYFRGLMRKDDPAVVISVHPMINHCLARAIKELGLPTKLIVVVTDPNVDLWRAWACPDAHLTVVPNDVVKSRLVQWGCDPEKVAIMGMPVHPDFVRPPSMTRGAFLSHLGLSSDLLTVCINAGWAGGGNMLKIYKELSQVKRNLQILFLCGHNTALYEKAMAAASESDVPTAVLPFHDCMSDLMASVDLMVSKAGGLTTYQALARRLPLVFDVITEPMPQERSTVDMLVEQRLAYSVHQPHDIVEIVSNFQPQPERDHCVLPAAYEFNVTDDAIFSIGHAILENCTPPVVLTPPVQAEVEQQQQCDLQPKSTANQGVAET
jgi:processive 1,2-diacylglycerol beta-glucosyltransferase